MNGSGGRHVLVLGGSTESRRLAALLAGNPALRVTTSLAGRVSTPAHHDGEVRVGGFGGAEGLARWLHEHAVDAVVDATHPFAEAISDHAVRAAAKAGVPLLAVRRPAWTAGPKDDWRAVGSFAEAAELLPAIGGRVFLATGRQAVAAFADLDDLWFLVRSVDPPEPPMPRRTRVLLDRGPYTVEGEAALLREHRIEVVVTRNSGGDATAGKLVAARELGLPVVVVQRPPVAAGVAAVPDPAGAVDWLSGLDRRSGGAGRCP